MKLITETQNPTSPLLTRARRLKTLTPRFGDLLRSKIEEKKCKWTEPELKAVLQALSIVPDTGLARYAEELTGLLSEQGEWMKTIRQMLWMMHGV